MEGGERGPHKQLSANIWGFAGKLQIGWETEILMTTLDKNLNRMYFAFTWYYIYI